MPKSQLNLLDCVATLKELKPRLTGLRLQNVYNLNNKTLLLKARRSQA